MATYQLRCFSNPLTLRAILPERLLAFLNPFRTFFAVRGYTLPQAEPAVEIDYPRLVSIFMSPDSNTPRELLDALFLVDEMATPEGMDVLLEAVAAENLTLDPGSDHSPADIAVQVWLLNSDILERKHAQRFLFKPRSFEYFQTKLDKPPVFTTPALAARRKLETELDDWFEKKKRGRNSRVFIYPSDNEVAFLVRHGEPFKREESQEGADVSSVCYWPIKYDVVVYDRLLGELRINAQLAGEKKLYCEQFGKHFFSDENCFPGKNKYTLEPLREDGVDSLPCGDIEGIELITLVEVEFLWGGAYHARDVNKADDIFADLEQRRRQLPEGGRITKAVFQVKFTDSKTPRSVTLRPSNVAAYTRDSDAELVEQWLERRRFIVHQREGTHEAIVPAVVGS
jgi:hypothetical protein